MNASKILVNDRIQLHNWEHGAVQAVVIFSGEEFFDCLMDYSFSGLKGSAGVSQMGCSCGQRTLCSVSMQNGNASIQMSRRFEIPPSADGFGHGCWARRGLLIVIEDALRDSIHPVSFLAARPNSLI
jgi:hypothetical protein